LKKLSNRQIHPAFRTSSLARILFRSKKRKGLVRRHGGRPHGCMVVLTNILDILCVGNEICITTIDDIIACSMSAISIPGLLILIHCLCKNGCQSFFLLLLHMQGLRPRSSVDMNPRESKAGDALLKTITLMVPREDEVLGTRAA
jgi:hypothetical protein